MAFFESLKTLINKINQKSIILVSGNIDDIISLSSSFFPFENDKRGFISIVDYISEFGKKNDYQKIEYFSPSKGVIDLLNENQKNPTKSEEKKEDDEFDDDFGNETNSSSFCDYVEKLTIYLNEIDEIREKHSSLHIVDCSDIFLDKSGNGIQPEKLAQLISNYMNFNKNDVFAKMVTSKKKLILMARNPETLTNFVPINNVEFASISINKPNKEERDEFIKTNRGFFNVKETILDSDHDDYKDAVSITDGHSFREILQLAKMEVDSGNEMTFKQLYSIANFNKRKSEWENLDASKLDKLKEFLEDSVKGQSYVVDKVKTTLIRSFIGLSGITQSTESKKPKGVLFFVGPTGVGKTEISKALTNFVFGDESRMIRFDMSEYNHEHSDQRLIGAPPGYVGYDAGGQLTSAVKNKPFSILLFDEIEKAHSKILDKFLQILEDGRLTSSQGEVVDFSETFIIFTSNIGSSNVSYEESEELIRKKFISEVTKFFKEKLERPEILNRIGMKNIIPFNFIHDSKIIFEIIENKLKKISDSIYTTKQIKIVISSENKQALFELIESDFKKEMGGRGLVVELETKLIDPLSNFIFENIEKFKSNRENKKITNIKGYVSNKMIKFQVIE